MGNYLLPNHIESTSSDIFDEVDFFIQW